MSDEAQSDLAAIKRAIEDGRRFTGRGGGYMVIWGAVVGLAEFATYMTRQGWLDLHLSTLWEICVPLGWIATALLWWRESSTPRVISLAGRVVAMMWLGCGITLTLLYLSNVLTAGFQPGWFIAAVAGIMGLAFFASSYLCDYPWMRGVAVAWWLGEFGFIAGRANVEILALFGAMMLLLLALPGFVLLRKPASA
jgi:hypothetical protein